MLPIGGSDQGHMPIMLHERTQDARDPFAVERDRAISLKPLRLDCGLDLTPFDIAYMTYGRLNADKSNAILVCHALTGDQYVASEHPVTGKPGWWETHDRPWQADRHQPLLRHLLERAWRLSRLDRAGLDQPCNGQSLWP